MWCWCADQFMMPALFARKASDADAHPQSMASGDLLITLSRVGSFRAGRHGDYYAQTFHVLDCSGGGGSCERVCTRSRIRMKWLASNRRG
jgi:hypothetical protein